MNGEMFGHCECIVESFVYTHRVPTQTGKPGKVGRHFPVREKSGNFDQTGKVREELGKITQNTGNSGNFRQILFVIF